MCVSFNTVGETEVAVVVVVIIIVVVVVYLCHSHDACFCVTVMISFLVMTSANEDEGGYVIVYHSSRSSQVEV